MKYLGHDEEVHKMISSRQTSHGMQLLNVGKLLMLPETKTWTMSILTILTVRTLCVRLLSFMYVLVTVQ